jgi:addiction module RelE/StbE family toxin
MYFLTYSNQVIEKDLPKLSSSAKSLIKLTIEKKLLTDPVKFGKPLRYNLKGCRSLRVSDYRVIYQIVETTINVLVIRHRRDCYSENKL